MSEEEDRKMLRILVTPMNAHGHINACHGLCEELRDRGHEITFLIDKSFAGRLECYGFRERYLSSPNDDNCDQEFWPNFVFQNAKRYEESSLVQLGDVLLEAFTKMFEQQNDLKEQFEVAIAEESPDLIIHDGYVCFPTVVNSSIPWIWLYSAAPHFMLNDRRIPPFFSGLPIDGDREEWDDFYTKAIEAIEPLHSRVSDYSVENGGDPLPEGQMHPFSKYLNIFMQPLELRYDELDDFPDNIVAVDCFVRTLPSHSFEIPESIRDLPGKLILFSMGSFGCANIDLMTRLVDILSRSPHRFIVSKGPLEYDLPGDNLYGEPFLPQTAVLPLVDLVITHGGNNTVTETFYFGKKMLVMPLFGDQYDNAQRISEVGLGRRLNPFKCTEQELLETIDSLANDDEMAERMELIGERIRASDDKQKVADMIENLFSE